ncbi:hypothetical protein PR202_gb01697 [Eleusine coracana subsp. coracana]|uniref:Uncharacterized protein n=1 Tax=Eleusine coracana subsp. coracana TaxID=191504 RepID=A0AAV5DXH5_ELECO|nr:hypothetical protein PR202_gb01697 [Eleusine coracana subsp. coracana]
MDLGVVAQDAGGAGVEAGFLQGQIMATLMPLALKEDMAVDLEMVGCPMVKMARGGKQRGAVAHASLTVEEASAPLLEEAVVANILMGRMGMSLDVHARDMSGTGRGYEMKRAKGPGMETWELDTEDAVHTEEITTAMVEDELQSLRFRSARRVQKMKRENRNLKISRLKVRGTMVAEATVMGGDVVNVGDSMVATPTVEVMAQLLLQ